VLSIGGLGAFVSVILNVLNSLGVVKDGQSATRIIGLNLLSVVALYAARVSGLEIDFKQGDQALNLLA